MTFTIISFSVSQTNRIRKLTEKRNRKVKDYLHKASRLVIRTAQEKGIGTIVIGRAVGWKQETDMYKRNNQNFTPIPHWKLIRMICYKAELAGIRVVIVDEKCTSGTSYHDCEPPERRYYRKERRKKRGLFVCDDGYRINADTNAAYQMMKKAGYAVSHSFMLDTIVEYFITNGKYNIVEINITLFDYDQPLLGEKAL